MAVTKKKRIVWRCSTMRTMIEAGRLACAATTCFEAKTNATFIHSPPAGLVPGLSRQEPSGRGERLKFQRLTFHSSARAVQRCEFVALDRTADQRPNSRRLDATRVSPPVAIRPVADRMRLEVPHPFRPITRRRRGA